MDKNSNVKAPLSPVSPLLDSPPSEAFDEQELSDLEDISGHIETKRKPHFLDYDFMDEIGNPSERVKVDKRLEHDGEVSDHDFAIACAGKTYKEEGTKKKHFLDENPIPPPEYMMKQDTNIRKHRSLDRNFDRAKDCTSKPSDNYSLNRFIEREVNPDALRGTWPTLEDSETVGSSRKPLVTVPPAAVDLGPKVECVYSLLNMLGQNDPVDMASKFFELSKNRETCIALRRSGCISILVQLLHSETDQVVRQKASIALHNVVYCHIDDKSGRREVRVLKLIEQLLEYCEFLRKLLSNGESVVDDSERHPIVSIGTLMKISFDEDHRHAMCTLGALQTISTLVQLDHEIHGAKSEDQNCITLRRYAGMTLTNLTFGDGNNKALLCSNKSFMKSLVMQIESNSDELVQVTASVLRNLSWRADTNMKQVLNEIGAVKILTKAAMGCSQENTLKSILSALWNLSNHCSTNKAEFCECEGAIDFLINMLNYDAPSKTMAVIENAGGILRNISSYIATKEEYRQILRERNCLGILLQQLKSSSLTVVSNASGTLGNLSANCVEDQKYLRDNGAIPMLRSLIYSKHKMISTGSTIALKNLLNYQKTGLPGQNLDSVSRSMDLKELPTLNVRKQRALEQELDQNLAHNCESDEVTTPPKDDHLKNIANIGSQARNLMSQLVKTQSQVPNNDDKLRTKSIKKNSVDLEEEEEEMVNFSVKSDDDKSKGESYQETDLDQPVNFSIRYAENVTDSEEDRSSPFERRQILMEEDCVRTYFTEGTPKVVSNSGSITDLRTAGTKDKSNINSQAKPSKSVQPKSNNAKPKKNITPVQNSGIQTPEKPVNYCEEGTPGDFSRCDSLSDLGELLEPQSPSTQASKVNHTNAFQEKHGQQSATTTPKTVKFSNFADGTPLETPLMYSRHSSVESLESAGSVCVADDKSSVVSDFSRLASGIISPSELPDSPTQSIPHSPRPHENNRKIHLTTARNNVVGNPASNDVFEDQTNAFLVENTPAQFSCATSLSNLSLDDEPKITKDCLVKEMQLMSHPSEEREDVVDSENLDDNYLLEQAINIGIQSSTTRGVGVGASCNNSDTMKEYCTEDTPAPLSKVGSNSNLSALSIETGHDQNRSGNISSATSDIDDGLLEAAIQDGIAKKSVTSHNAVKENPIERMRRGAIPPYLPVGDETNQFGIEGSPKTFSVASGLSGITVGSEVIGLAKLPRSTNNPSCSQQQDQVFDDSLSSLSIDSVEDEANILNQAIVEGARTLMSNRNQHHRDAHDSYSSIESCDDQQNSSLLEQAVQSGMQKVVKTKQASQTTSSSKTSKHKQPLGSDELLLEEAINTGIKKTTGQPPKKGSQPVNIPKNGKSSTSVVVLENVTITNTGVEKASMQHITKEKDTNAYENAVFQHQHLHQQRLIEQDRHSNGSNMSTSAASGHSLMFRSNEYPALKLSAYEFSENSCADSYMEISNEFMIEKGTLAEISTDKHKNPDLMLRSVDRLTQQLVATAEYLRQTDPNCVRQMRERKNSSSTHTWNEDSVSFPSISVDAPNMIGSVNDEENTFNDLKSMGSQKKSPVEEPTPTNENQEFIEKVSGDKRMYSYTNDSLLKDASLERTLRYDDNDGFDSIDTVRHNSELNDSGIRFELGGEVNYPVRGASITFSSSGPMSIDSCSTMTNSTIICMEANKVAADLQNYSPSDSLASLDLDNIRPPSVMDCVSLSTVTYDVPVTYSPQLPRSRKKSLPVAIVARRALGQLGSRGSVESVNSLGHTNLDNIKPPSIMDELLDSMISVASITSEVADNNVQQHMQSSSHYETAMSEIDDTTLQSCLDLPNENDATPIQSDFSSNESTPRKGQRSLTPKQRRQVSDRYRTYTISSNNSNDLKKEDDEMLQVEIDDYKRLTPREKRKENRGRFETQVLDPVVLEMVPRSGENSPSKRRLENPDRFKTRTLSNSVLREANVVIQSLQNQTITVNEDFLLDEAASDCISLVSNDDVTEDLSIKAVTAHLKYIQNTNNLSKISHARMLAARQFDDGSDFTSLEFEQSSETESCDQNRFSDNSNDGLNKMRTKVINRSSDLYLDSAGDEGGSSPEPKGVRGKKKPAYVSPYKRTSLSNVASTSPKKYLNKPIATKKNVTPSSIKPPSIDTKKQPLVNRNILSNKIKTIKTNNDIPTVTRTNVICKSKTYTEISSHCGSKSNAPQMPERQGTFIKEEGTDLDVPVVTSAPATPSKQNKFTSKIPSNTGSVAKTFVSKMRIPLYRSGSTPDPDSSKNRKLSINKSPSVPSVPATQRSNVPVKGHLSPAKSANQVAPKKDITSKIAGIWKKIDESKKQQTSKKDTRVWIGSKPKQDVNVVSTKPPVIPQLIRSSTFDADPKLGTKKALPNITKGRTIKSPSSGNLKSIVSAAPTERRGSLLTNAFKRT